MSRPLCLYIHAHASFRTKSIFRFGISPAEFSTVFREGVKRLHKFFLAQTFFRLLFKADPTKLFFLLWPPFTKRREPTLPVCWTCNNFVFLSSPFFPPSSYNLCSEKAFRQMENLFRNPAHWAAIFIGKYKWNDNHDWEGGEDCKWNYRQLRRRLFFYWHWKLNADWQKWL